MATVTAAPANDPPVEYVRRRYQDGVKMGDIAKSLGTTRKVIARILRNDGVDRRGHLTPVARARLADKAWLVEQYAVQQRTGVDLASELGCSCATISGALRRHAIATRSHVEEAQLRMAREHEEQRERNRAVEQANEARATRRMDAQRLREERHSRGQRLDCDGAATSGTTRCDACRARRQERDVRRHAGGTPHVSEPRTPDSGPAVCLRLALAQHREAGLSFRHGWALAMTEAINKVKPDDRAGWRDALEFARPDFESSYARSGNPLTLAGIEPGESVERW